MDQRRTRLIAINEKQYVSFIKSFDRSFSFLKMCIVLLVLNLLLSCTIIFVL